MIQTLSNIYKRDSWQDYFPRYYNDTVETAPKFSLLRNVLVPDKRYNNWTWEDSFFSYDKSSEPIYQFPIIDAEPTFLFIPDSVYFDIVGATRVEIGTIYFDIFGETKFKNKLFYEESLDENLDYSDSTVFSMAHKGGLELKETIFNILSTTPEQPLENGITNSAVKILEKIIEEKGVLSINIIGQYLNNDIIPEIASETLQFLGSIEQPATYDLRLNLLKKYLSSQSVWLRDGSILGLASLADKNTIDDIKKAMDNEQITWLKAYMQRVLNRLETSF